MSLQPDARRVHQANCLWQDSGGPDNLVDEQFLSSLVLKQEVAWSYWGVVSGASAAARQISVVGMVSAITGRLYQGTLSPGMLLAANLAGAAMVVIAVASSGQTLQPESVGRAVRRVALLLAGTYLLSPLLQTLTRTTSSDTIVSLAVHMLLAHLFLHDYSLRLSLTDRAAGAVSLAAAIFASVVIASRLANHLQVFSQVLLSLEVYLMLPYLLHSLMEARPLMSVAATVACSLACCALLLPLQPALYIFVAVLCFVTFVCPFWLVGLQRRSAHPSGPWDVADIHPLRHY